MYCYMWLHCRHRHLCCPGQQPNFQRRCQRHQHCCSQGSRLAYGLHAWQPGWWAGAEDCLLELLKGQVFPTANVRPVLGISGKWRPVRQMRSAGPTDQPPVPAAEAATSLMGKPLLASPAGCGGRLRWRVSPSRCPGCCASDGKTC